MTPETDFEPRQVDPDLEQLSEDLKAQVRRAKDRISDRYTRLVEERPFDKPREEKD
jgi:hypothetical protein